MSGTWCTACCFEVKLYLKTCKGQTFKGNSISIWKDKSQTELLSS